MAESDSNPTNSGSQSVAVADRGPASTFLAQNGFEHEWLGRDHAGVEMVSVDRNFLLPICTALYGYGYNYLQCQCGYDQGAGQSLVSMYHLIKIADWQPDQAKPEEVRIKVFLPREDPRVPSVYWIWKTADWQERESFDMFGILYDGHPNLKRILMPEDWIGWPMRKDYITPDFYELQDAY